jgi:hypothetical protein
MIHLVMGFIIQNLAFLVVFIQVYVLTASLVYLKYPNLKVYPDFDQFALLQILQQILLSFT